MMYSKIFLELNPQSDNTSAETTLIEQDNGVCYKADKNHGKTSSHLKTDISKKLMVQTNLSYMYSEQVYTCLHCLVCVSGECTNTNHVETCSKYKCAKCNKTLFSEHTFNKHQCNCPPKRYPCKICEKDYSQQSDVNKHMKTHVPIRNTFTCHWCACQFLTGKQLKLHMSKIMGIYNIRKHLQRDNWW